MCPIPTRSHADTATPTLPIPPDILPDLILIIQTPMDIWERTVRKYRVQLSASAVDQLNAGMAADKRVHMRRQRGFVSRITLVWFLGRLLSHEQSKLTQWTPPYYRPGKGSAQ